MKEIDPTCVLDFYVHESIQRQGIGKQLFEMALSYYDTPPAKLAYDKPSNKLLSFLSKHYGLKRFVPQPNNFVVFSQYFTTDYVSGKKRTPMRIVPAGATHGFEGGMGTKF